MNIKVTIAIIAAVLAVLILAGLICFWIRRRRSKKRVSRMGMPEKLRLLEELAEPFGFFYLSEPDVFTGRLDAWQKDAGYQPLFDRAAVYFHMAFDALPVYFDYDGKTWLIELWKGQYGVTTGAEIGVYHAGRLLTEEERKRAHFQAADEREMPEIYCGLEKGGNRMFDIRKRHWWLAGFRVGEFSSPKQLRMSTAIVFADAQQARQFFYGLGESGLGRNKYWLCGNKVYVRFDCSPSGSGFFLFRWFVQCQNLLCCKLYLLVTRPFTETADRMLFLYFQLPGCFRRMLKRLARRRKRRGCV